MTHQMDPPEDASALDPEEVERRLRGEFPFVEADPKAGAEHVAGMIRQFERMPIPDEVIQEHRRVQSSAVQFIVADSPDFGDAYLVFTAIPGQGLFVGYNSAERERVSGPLLQRCARALGYEITEI